MEGSLDGGKYLLVEGALQLVLHPVVQADYMELVPARGLHDLDSFVDLGHGLDPIHCVNAAGLLDSEREEADRAIVSELGAADIDLFDVVEVVVSEALRDEEPNPVLVLPVEDQDLKGIKQYYQHTEEWLWGLPQHIVRIPFEIEYIELVHKYHRQVTRIEPWPQPQNNVVDDLWNQPQPLQEDEQPRVIVVEESYEVHKAQAVEHHVPLDGVDWPDS